MSAAPSPPPPRIPRATYRIQFHAGFRLADAIARLPHLAALGISDLYASPLLTARPGSTHGYDVIDPDRLNPELGSDADFDALHRALDAHGMRLLLDIVPNHMGVIEADNAWWLEVLEHGPAAWHARAFDIEWEPPQRELRGRLLVAVLGGPYGDVLEAGELQPAFDARRGQFVVRYHGHRFPIDPSDHAALLRALSLPEALRAAHGVRLQTLIEGFAALPSRNTTDEAMRAQRRGEATALKTALAQMHGEVPGFAAWLDTCAAALAGRIGEPASFDRLDRLLERQVWRLAHWRTAGAQINYRRFFDINGLAGLRMEDDEVFEAAHRRILAWVGTGRVAGLRIDHPDGMADPAAYFERLQRRCAAVLDQADAPRAIYLVAEKILADDEPWRRDWPVHGDTGYRFANQALGLFVNGANEPAFDALSAAFVGSAVDFDAELDAAKRATMNVSLGADLSLLTEMARSLALLDRHTRDLTRDDLRDAIVELAGAFDVYRSYVSARGAGPLDVARVEKCAALARARCRPSQTVHVDFLRNALLHEGDEAEDQRALRLRFVLRFQQFTAPVMAKSMEDTAFYRHHRLVSLNDVGGDPRRFGMGTAALHAANALRMQEMPHTLLATSTHDSKRSEDMRARLNVLSEMPEVWAATLERWHALAQTQWKLGVEAPEPPSASDELLLFQTLVGICPPDLPDDAALQGLRERVGAYMLKAIREAKQRSSWLEGDDGYEAAVQRSIEVLLARIEPNPFLSDLRRFVATIAPFGAANSLGLVALKLTTPGVPDVYQGCEDWDFALVDPDNRRPVDFDAIGARLAGIDAHLAAGHAPATLPADLHKLHLTRALLRWRAEAAALFEHGDYRPLEVTGTLAEHVFAYARCVDGQCSVTVVTRLPWQRCEGNPDRLGDASLWRDTTVALPTWPAAGAAPRAWHELVSGRRIEMAGDAATLALGSLMGGFPVAVLRPGG